MRGAMMRQHTRRSRWGAQCILFCTDCFQVSERPVGGLSPWEAGGVGLVCNRWLWTRLQTATEAPTPPEEWSCLGRSTSDGQSSRSRTESEEHKNLQDEWRRRGLLAPQEELAGDGGLGLDRSQAL